MSDPFAPTSDHARTLAERAAAELSALADKRKSPVKSERDAVAGIRGFQEGRSNTPRVNPFKIKVRSGFNARDFSTAEAIADDAELADSIKAKGVLKSLTVTIDEDGVTLWLVNGERRLRETIRAINEGTPIETVPVDVAPNGMNDADLVASQVVHNSGRRFTLLELGDIVRRLVGYGWDEAKIAIDAMIPVHRQKAAMEAMELSPDMQAVIRAGDGSAKFVSNTIKTAPTRAEGEQRVKEAVAKAKSEGAPRAMPKHVAAGPTSKTERAVVVEAFQSAEIARDVSGAVVVTFAGEAFEALVGKFNLRV